LKQSHASLLLSKVERGRFSLGGARDVLDLLGGGQLILTPLLLICLGGCMYMYAYADVC
jgi:hypothetical protein